LLLWALRARSIDRLLQQQGVAGECGQWSLSVYVGSWNADLLKLRLFTKRISDFKNSPFIDDFAGKTIKQLWQGTRVDVERDLTARKSTSRIMK